MKGWAAGTYLALSLAWIAWGIYKPIHEFRAQTVSTRSASAWQVISESPAAPPKTLPKDFTGWDAAPANGVALTPDSFMGSTERLKRRSGASSTTADAGDPLDQMLAGMKAAAAPGIVEIYRERGYGAIAIFCFAPPLLGYLLIAGYVQARTISRESIRSRVDFLGLRAEVWPWVRAALALAAVILAMRVWIPTFNTWWILYGYDSAYDRGKKAFAIMLIAAVAIACLESLRKPRD